MPLKMKSFPKLLIAVTILTLLYLSRHELQNRYVSTLPYIALQHESIAQEITFKIKKCRTANDTKLLMKETEQYITAAHHRYDRAVAQILFPIRVPITVQKGSPFVVKQFEFCNIKNTKPDSIARRSLPAKDLIFEGVIIFKKDTPVNGPLLGYCLFADRHGHTICQSANVIYIKSDTTGKECYYAYRKYRFRTTIANTKELADLHHVIFVSQKKYLAATK